MYGVNYSYYNIMIQMNERTLQKDNLFLSGENKLFQQ